MSRHLLLNMLSEPRRPRVRLDMKKGLKGLLAAGALYYSILGVVGLAKIVTGRSRFNVIIKLLLKQSHLMFFPKMITKPGQHYACKIGDVTGFQRTEGYSSEFSPVINVFEQSVTLFKMSCLFNFNLAFRVEREDDLYLRLSEPRFVIGHYVSPSLEFVSGDVATLGYMDEDRCRVQVQAAPYVGCDLLLSEYEECRFRTGNKPNMGYLAFVSKGMEMGMEDIPRMSQALKEEMRPIYYEPWVCPVVLGGDGDVETTPLEKELDLDPTYVKPLGKILPSPHTSESIVYKVNKSGETITYEDRIRKYAKDAPPVDNEMKNWANEFIQVLIPERDAGAAVLEDLDTVLQAQRPSQRIGYDQIKDLQDMLYVEQDKTFQKNEVYPDFKAPRNIINPNHGKRVLTALMVKPLSKYLKENSLKHIYGFGDAQYLQDTFQRVENLDPPGIEARGFFETDGTKMDATIIKFIREDLELAILLRLFHPSQHEYVSEIHLAQYAEDPKTKFGIKMKLYASRRSGEGGTSIFNTITMVYVFYCWLRSLGFTPKQAWKRLGAYGGDDGLTPAWGESQSLIDVAARVNIILKVVHAPSGKPFSFLGMIKFPGMDLYLPDVVRFCGKIAYSHVKAVPVEQVLLRKCLPYVQMFPNVPLVGNLCRAVLRILKNQGASTLNPCYDDICRSGMGFVLTMLDGTSMPSVNDEFTLELAEFHICSGLGMSLTSLRDVCESYDNATSFDQFPTGYVQNGNTYLDCKYEVLIRDLYIPGRTEVKLLDHLPTESLPVNGCTISIQNEQTQDETNRKQEQLATQSISSTSETSSVVSAASERPAEKARAGKRARKRKKTPAVKAGGGLLENGSSSS